MSNPLDDARDKLKRARRHLSALKREATKFSRDPTRHQMLAAYDTGEGRYVVYSKLSPGPLPNLSLILGDVIHNARGALDFTTWQLAIQKLKREPTDTEAPNIQFPITFHRRQFQVSRLWPYVASEARDEMLRSQPHPGSDARNENLAVLQWISNRDKHRFVLPRIAFIDPPLVPRYEFAPPLPPATVVSQSLLVGPRRGAPLAQTYYKGDPTTVRFGWIDLSPQPARTEVHVPSDNAVEIVFSGRDRYLAVSDIKNVVDEVARIIRNLEKRFFS